MPDMISDLTKSLDEAISEMYESEGIFTSHMPGGDSTRAEFNLTIYIASHLIKRHFSICAESPFKRISNGGICHLDFVAQSRATLGSDTLILFECKRIAPQKMREKLLEILEDYDRISSWPNLSPDCRPLHFSFLDSETRVLGVIAILITDEPSIQIHRRKIPSIVNRVFSTWWSNRSIQPENYPLDLTTRISQMLDKAVIVKSSQGKYPRDTNITATAYAIFDLGTLGTKPSL